MIRALTAFLLAGAASAGIASATAYAAPDPGPGPGMCQYIGTHYPIYYPCNEFQPWLPYGTYDNPPAGGGSSGIGVPGLGDAKPSS
ncbi:hypothetical protein [Mycobacterium heckeshornense]|uniref:hypothetical protein n=1 Tax=Mycobacterium heckeshornense TaxID=110505 RepID=UPI000662C02A|nr:hypothetical protein [Mycobacterium heckeshornense]KMV23322.1 hypothetical protein ACT16_06495 [Mycobacterium heckeshornense]